MIKRRKSWSFSSTNSSALWSSSWVAPLQDLCCLLPPYLEHLEPAHPERVWRNFMKNKCYGNLSSFIYIFKNHSNHKLCRDLQQPSETRFRDSCIHRKWSVWSEVWLLFKRTPTFFPHLMTSLVLQNFPNESRVKVGPCSGVWCYFYHSQSENSHCKW